MQQSQKELTSTFAEKHVGDIVSENYHAAGVFKKHGIDFCCGGGQPLGVVCEKKGVDLSLVTQALEDVSWKNEVGSERYNEWSLSFLIDYIINTHHSYVREKTQEIPVYGAKVARVHGERHPENVEIFKQFAALSNELIEHLQDEEKTVFPLIQRIENKQQQEKPMNEEELAELKMQLNEMMEDHTEAGQIMAEIKSLSNDFTPPEGACATWRVFYKNLAGFEEDLHKHVHLENNILFKKAAELLN